MDLGRIQDIQTTEETVIHDKTYSIWGFVALLV
jgi:hypothetical protein